MPGDTRHARGKVRRRTRQYVERFGRARRRKPG